MLGGFVDVLAGLQVGRIAQADLDAVRGRAASALTTPEAAARRLPGLAEDLLTGRPPRGLEDLRAELWAVTPQQVHAVAVEAAGTSLMQVPSGHTADWAGYTEAPTSSPYAVTGRRFEQARDGGAALVVGDEGVSLTCTERDGTQRAATVLYRACAAVLNWPDGGRRLIGTDGICVALEPGGYGVDAPTLAAVDAAVPPAAVVRLPPRQNQPRPETAAAAPGGNDAATPPPAPVRRTAGQTAAWVVLGLLTVVCAFVALSVTVFGDDPQTGVGAWIALSAFFWGVTALLAWPALRIVRRTRGT